MRKAALAAIVVTAGLAAIVAVRSYPLGTGFSPQQSRERAATSLQSRIDTIKKANADRNRRTQQKLEVSEAELESYVLVELKKDIPVAVESIHVQLMPGTIAADARLTIPSGSTGNVLVDTLVSGTHNIYVKGRMSAARSVGKFDLLDVRVDGIPVPNILIDTLIRKYAKPKYPDVDLKESFDLPWGIEAIEIGRGKATITY